MNDIESRLRTSLNEHAAHTPPGDQLAERILRTVEVEVPGRVLRPRRGWSTWTMPLLAAAAVAAIVATLVGVGQLRHSAAPEPPAASQLAPSYPAPGPPATRTPAPATPKTSTTAPVSRPNAATVTGFHALDLTFVGPGEGWALGPADCVSGTGSCTALFHTTDGSTWTSLPGASFNVPGVQNCASPCVDHIRFANQDVGYAYSPETLFMTTDGGRTWTPQPGRGADALETLDNDVIRLVSDGTGCPGPCNIRAETAPIGSSTWTAAPLQPDGSSVGTVQLSRGGSAAYVLVTANPAGGASEETSTLFVSTDDGITWHKHADPCPQSGGEVDSVAVAGAPAGRVSVLCAPRDGAPAFALISRDGGASFTRQPATLPRSAAVLLAGDPNSVLVAAGSTAYRYDLASARWERIADLTGKVGFLGFESADVAHAVTDGGRKVWTTVDGGQTWTPFEFR